MMQQSTSAQFLRIEIDQDISIDKYLIAYWLLHGQTLNP